MKTSGLNHRTRNANDYCVVTLLDIGTSINPEEQAMLQALHSRSSQSMSDHLLKVEERGAENFISQYYVGYGDKSIGDCGTLTLFIEGCSMLCAKAIQGFQLYLGQERSTRYGNFGDQVWFTGDQKNSKVQWEHISHNSTILENLRSVYRAVLQAKIEQLTAQHPFDESMGVTKGEYEKAIRARAFDVARSFLPAGASTNLSWHVNLRQCRDHLLRLRNHPLAEVKEVATAIEELLVEAYPSSFNKKRYPATEYFTMECLSETPLTGTNCQVFDCPLDVEGDVTLFHDGMNKQLLHRWELQLAGRPEKAELDKSLALAGTFGFLLKLDYGSYRDLQRHRAIVQGIPRLGFDLGFHPWYLDQIKDLDLPFNVTKFLNGMQQECGTHWKTTCYHVPMGYQVGVPISGDLPALVWLMELRSGKAVHPTLRKASQDMAKIVRRRLGPGFRRMKLYIDESGDDFNPLRGKHDIVAK